MLWLFFYFHILYSSGLFCFKSQGSNKQYFLEISCHLTFSNLLLKLYSDDFMITFCLFILYMYTTEFWLHIKRDHLLKLLTGYINHSVHVSVCVWWVKSTHLHNMFLNFTVGLVLFRFGCRKAILDMYMGWLYMCWSCISFFDRFFWFLLDSGS